MIVFWYGICGSYMLKRSFFVGSVWLGFWAVDACLCSRLQFSYSRFISELENLLSLQSRFFVVGRAELMIHVLLQQYGV